LITKSLGTLWFLVYRRGVGGGAGRREGGRVAVGHRDGIAECEVAGVRESLCRFPRNFKFFSCLSFAAFSIMSCKKKQVE